MTFKETQKMLNFLRSAGVNHFKSGDFEVSFSQTMPVPLQGIETRKVSKSRTPAHGGAIPPVQSDIPHHINEVKSLLAMPDEEFVMKMFPDENDPQQKAE